MPKVSVLMPTYNTNPDYLREAIDSILAQTFIDFEFLILDDCSTEPRVKEVVSSFTDKRIKFFENEYNLGISDSRNRLIELAKGEYLAVTDHDDISLPARLEKESAFLDAHPETGVVGCWLEHLPDHKVQKFPEESYMIEDSLMYLDAVPHQASMLRKSVLAENEIFYEKDFSPAEDYRLCLRLLGKTKFYNLQMPLLQYRKYDGNTSNIRSIECTAHGEVARDLARKKQPLIWYRARKRYMTKSRYKLFGLLTFLTVLEMEKEKHYCLFDCLTILKKTCSHRIIK